jgi:5-methylcytosine-specific restriction endonuclease McrA
LAAPWWIRKRTKRTKRRRRFTRGQLTLNLKPPRRGKDWRKARAAAETDFCEIPRCGKFLHDQLGDGTVARRHPAIDHIVPELLLFKFGITNPHEAVNLICLCRECHGRKKTVEDRLFRGDKLGFLAGLRALGWPMERVEAALKFYSL